MNHASLFSGIGGFESAAQWMGWENVLHCEINEFGKHILKHYWPNATSYDDIRKTDFTIWRGHIDVLTGGFPCQPYSLAGKRKGKEDDRHLWPEMLRAIREIQPRWVVGENVFGIVNWNGGLVFNEVQADLEAEWYEVQPFILPACAVNAPHRRERVWFIAYSESNRNRRRLHEMESENGSKWEPQECRQDNNEYWNDGTKRATTDPHSAPTEHTISTGRNVLAGKDGAGLTTNARLQRQTFSQQQATGIEQCSGWECFPTQSPVCSRNDGLPAELLRQRIREDSMGHLSEKEIDKIISKAHTEWRNESIKAFGNAVVPQVVLQIFKAIETLNNHG
jgi:DNA (cytosine-5)-methyltransferase 1